MVLGVDLKKDPRRLHDAYNDSAGITAQFTLNLLRRMNPRARRQPSICRPCPRGVLQSDRGAA
jgi:hypothetical protein